MPCFPCFGMNHRSAVVIARQSAASESRPGTVMTVVTSVHQGTSESEVMEKKGCRPFQSLMAALQRFFRCLKRFSCFPTTTEMPPAAKQQRENVEKIIVVLQDKRQQGDISEKFFPGNTENSASAQEIFIAQKIYSKAELGRFDFDVLAGALKVAIKNTPVFNNDDVVRIINTPQDLSALFQRRREALPADTQTMLNAIMACFARLSVDPVVTEKTGMNRTRMIQEILPDLLGAAACNNQVAAVLKNPELSKNKELCNAVSDLLFRCSQLHKP